MSHNFLFEGRRFQSLDDACTRNSCVHNVDGIKTNIDVIVESLVICLTGYPSPSGCGYTNILKNTMLEVLLLMNI